MDACTVMLLFVKNILTFFTQLHQQLRGLRLSLHMAISTTYKQPKKLFAINLLLHLGHHFVM